MNPSVPTNSKPMINIDHQLIFWLGFGLMTHIAIAWMLPITNDEAYYWDWGQSLRLSYFDHPPGVAYLTWVASKLGAGPLAIRGLAPWTHLLGTVFLVKTLRELKADPQAAVKLVKIMMLTPGLTFTGIVALPDTGLFPTLAGLLYLAVKFCLTANLSIGDATLYGLTMGMAGLCKYHALPIAGGMTLALIVYRSRVQFKLVDLKFVAIAATVAILVCTPVWIWNIENNGASFLFQLGHGFAAPSFSVVKGLRLFATQIVLLGPILWWSCLRTIFLPKMSPESPQSQRSPQRGVILAGALPLLILLSMLGFYKDTMPHWLLPAWTILLPLVVMQNQTKHLVYWQGLWAAVIGIPLLGISIKPLREQILMHLDGQPGPLAEITVWPYLAGHLDQLLSHNVPGEPPPPPQPPNCPPSPIVGGMRWYTVAQLRFHLKAQQPVLSFDMDHMSYYSDRDRNLDLKGCEAWVIALDGAQSSKKLVNVAEILEERHLTIKFHEKMPIMLRRLRLR